MPIAKPLARGRRRLLAWGRAMKTEKKRGVAAVHRTDWFDDARFELFLRQGGSDTL